MINTTYRIDAPGQRINKDKLSFGSDNKAQCSQCPHCLSDDGLRQDAAETYSSPKAAHYEGLLFNAPKHGEVQNDELIKTAVKMNRIAFKNAKNPPVYTYPKATPEDLERLTSEAIDDSYKRATWINPEDGKTYHLLEESKRYDDDGLTIKDVAVRILDEEGEFIKEAVMEPKNIVIMDHFNYNIEHDYANLELSHGNMVANFAKRNNPWANYIYIDSDCLDKQLKKLISEIDNGRQIDILNLSFGQNITKSELEKILDAKISKKTRQEIEDALFGYYENSGHYSLRYKLLKELVKRGVRVLASSGNEKSDSINICALVNGVEGVRAIGKGDKGGEILFNPLLRNNEFTPHYEAGEVRYTQTEEGINETGIHGTDFSYPSLEALKTKSLENDLVAMEELEEMIKEESYLVNGRSSCYFDHDKIMERLEGKIVTIEGYKRLGYSTPEDGPKLQSKYYYIADRYKIFVTKQNEEGALVPAIIGNRFDGTSFSAPVRCAKIALNEMMKEVL